MKLPLGIHGSLLRGYCIYSKRKLRNKFTDQYFIIRAMTYQSDGRFGALGRVRVRQEADGLIPKHHKNEQ